MRKDTAVCSYFKVATMFSGEKVIIRQNLGEPLRENLFCMWRISTSVRDRFVKQKQKSEDQRNFPIGKKYQRYQKKSAPLFYRGAFFWVCLLSEKDLKIRTHR